jgi:hypothetical protein
VPFAGRRRGIKTPRMRRVPQSSVKGILPGQGPKREQPRRTACAPVGKPLSLSALLLATALQVRCWFCSPSCPENLHIRDEKLETIF